MGILLVGYDGSEPSRRALDYAIRRAKALGDEIVLLNVIPASIAKSSLSSMMPAGLALPPPLDKSFSDHAWDRLAETVASYAAQGVRMRAELRQGDAAFALAQAAQELKVDEVVIGHKSYESEDLDLGPVAERLVKAMPAIVTVVR